MPKKRGIVHPKSWSFLEFSSGAMFNNKPLLYDFDLRYVHTLLKHQLILLRPT
ncbi:hypothetical protein [Nostoc sp. NOS(2021)]|uniref:hypothetical protein n=1 Tax=Nostoc sp. NOS(2021) TaxID=2815407 RepID=UPI0025EBDDC8|nr:hypothetical protein [Nostoc sp. NOS(2021)]